MNVQKYKWLKCYKLYILNKIIPYDIMIDKIACHYLKNGASDSNRDKFKTLM